MRALTHACFVSRCRNSTQFILMGDGNMHWSTAFAKLPGVHTVHVRHEHCTVAAATAYNVATAKSPLPPSRAALA